MTDAKDSFLGRRIPIKESLGHLSGSGARPPSRDMGPSNASPATADATPASSPNPPSFLTREPRWKLDDLIVSDSTLAAIRQTFASIEHHATLYDEWRLSQLEPSGRRVVVNLYGMPGTGKTMCADATASHFSKRVLEVSYAEIESKYVGDTPKNIAAAFRCAAEAEAVLFFDEADSILGRRMTNVTQAADHGVNVSRAVMLKELDAFVGVVVFATNLAKNFDGAFVRRILTHIAFPAPDEPARNRLWKKLVPAQMPGRVTLDFAALAATSAGPTGGKIKNAIILAASSAVTRNGSEKQVRMSDIEAAIAHVKQSKRDVGRYDYDGPTVRVEKVIEPLPPGMEFPALAANDVGGRPP